MQHRVSFPLGRSAPALARVLALALCLSLGALTCSFSGAAVAAEPEREFLNAARNGELASLRRLIDEGVSLTTANSAGRTALMVAAFFGNLGVVHLLLAEGVDVNASDGNGRTALMEAAANGHLPVVQVLVGRVGDLNQADSTQHNAHGLATLAGHQGVADLLEKAGATKTP